MDDCIEREPLLKAFKEKCCQDCPGGYSRQQCHSWCDAASEIEMIENAPAVELTANLWHDAKPTRRRTAGTSSCTAMTSAL